jgi:peroxiredoxin Q/BCP
MTHLEPGMPAPDFSLPDADGELHSLSSFKGRKLVLYFYPKDDTPTCTAQACNLRDHNSELAAAGLQVVGISPDTVKSHKKFESKFNLPFLLLADEDHRTADAYGVWGEKMLYGRKYMGVHRVSFLIDESGHIAHIIDKVESKNHSDQILSIWNVDVQ